MHRFLSGMIFILLSTQLNAQQVAETQQQRPPIYIAFLWHMHQPIYWPGETILQTQAAGYYPYSVFDIHNSRTGPYTNWPADAVQKTIDAGLPFAGASVSFSGTLIENLNHLEASGNANFQNWTAPWNAAVNKRTTGGNPRMDMIGFGYYHPLMGLIGRDDIRAQIRRHKDIMAETFEGAYSKGIFPPENAFSEDMIPALVAEGLEWVLVDNIHFERAAEGYPFSTEGNLYEPNKADIRNPDPGDWVQLNGLWAPTRISAQWGHQPHFVEYTDPETGIKDRIIAVPTSRYLGNEDGRGGFGALQYEAVMSQLEAYNTDPDHPVLIVLHHDGDNFGGGSESYYNSNFQAFADWAANNSDRFVPTTIQDYLDRFPPDNSDVIHVESGSWAGADNGDPEFKKWLGDPGSDGYSPDRNSWGVLTAAQNFVEQAEDLDPGNPVVVQAREYLLNAQGSDYWYWDNSIDGIWDTHPTTASNLAIEAAEQVLASAGVDTTPPSIFKPQREPYNPGATEWNMAQDNEVEIWTYAFDRSGLQHVNLNYRLLADNEFPVEMTTHFGQISSSDTSWRSVPMDSTFMSGRTNTEPLFKAAQYSITLNDIQDRYVEYFVEAVDEHGNTARSLIQSFWIGSDDAGAGGGGDSGNGDLTILPEHPTSDDSIRIQIRNATQNAMLHWGVNPRGSVWQTPDGSFWPDSTSIFNGDGPAVESPMTFNADSAILEITIGPFSGAQQQVRQIAFVIHYDNDTWDNNNGNDYIIDLDVTDSSGTDTGHSFVMDGDLDTQAIPLISDETNTLYVDWNPPYLYLATTSATTKSGDTFLFVSDGSGELVNSPWSKSGMVAGWNAYLANEHSNNYHSWFDQSATSQSAAGNYLEGVLDLQNEFGVIPERVYLALAVFGNDDNTGLITQLPAGNGDNIISTDEFEAFDYVLTSAETITRPDEYRLTQNYPNPFNPSTRIGFEIAEPAPVELAVFDLLGRQIEVLVNGRKTPGYHEVSFNASNLASGIYFYQLKVADNVIDTRRMVLMK